MNFFHPIIYILLSLFVLISTKYYISKSSQHNHIPTRASASPLKQTHPHPSYPTQPSRGNASPLARKRIPSCEQTSTPPRHLSQKTVRALVAIVLINVPPRRPAPLIHRPVQIHPRSDQSNRARHPPRQLGEPHAEVRGPMPAGKRPVASSLCTILEDHVMRHQFRCSKSS